MKIACVSTVLLCLFFTIARSERDSLSINNKQGKTPLLNHVYYTTTDEMADAASVAKLWATHPEAFEIDRHYNFGYRPEIFWFVMSFRKEAEAQVLGDYMLEVDNPQLDKVTLYLLHGDSVKQIGRETGDDLPFHSRSFIHPNFVWPFNGTQVNGKTLLLRIDKRNSALKVPLYWWHANDFRADTARKLLFYGLCFGMMLLVALYSLFAALVIRKSVFATYFMLVVAAIIFLAAKQGLAFQFLYPTWGGFNSVFRVAIAAIATSMLLLFTNDFLNLHQHWRPGSIIIKTIVSVNGLLLISAPWLTPFYYQYRMYVVPPILLMVIVGGATCLVSAFKTYSRQKAVALFYLAAYATTIIAGALTVLEDYGRIDQLPVNIMFVAILIEILVFTVALTRMMGHVYEQRNEMALQISRHQRMLMQSYIDGIELERQRVSKDLHDDIGSRLSLLKKLLEAGKTTASSLQEQLEKLAGDIRTMSHRLSPPNLLANDFARMVEALGNDFQHTYNLAVHVQFFDFPPSLPEKMQTELYRILQEALQNTARHASASGVDMQFFRHDNELVITVEDDGVGFDHTTNGGGIGLKNMTARAAALQGRLEVSAAPGKGTTVVVTVPFSSTAVES